MRQLKTLAAEKTGSLPSNMSLLAEYRELVENGELEESPELTRLLTKRKVRSLSGVSVIAVLTRPFGCPGSCTFCPTEVNMPKSYLPNQPGAMRAIRNKFDPFNQVAERLNSLQKCGHPAEKIELIILGGTWTALPKWYQTWFVRRCLQALNRSKLGSLEELKIANEHARHKLVGFTIETRPDWIDTKEIRRQRRLGVTRVELGAQSVYDDVLARTKRGHKTAKTIEAVRLLKDAGMKVGLHLMPNLPLSSPKRDIDMMRTVFESGDYCPDQIKIYPCSVLPRTKLEKEWKAGEYKPYSNAKLADVIAEVYKVVPEYCRISRVVRDIPEGNILAGSKMSNLRQVLDNKGIRAHDIREREIKGGTVDPADIEMIEREFNTSGGQEVFLSYEAVKADKLIAFARLRLPGAGKTAFIREVHSYGFETPVGKSGSQHRGFGKKLIKQAEQLTRKAGFAKVCVPAGVGVRAYYAKLGYELENDYMAKTLN